MKQTKYGITAELKEDFKQSQYETYQTRLLEITKEITNAATVERAIVQAAKDAGILSGVDGLLLDYPPRVIKWLTVITNKFINEQVEVSQD